MKKISRTKRYKIVLSCLKIVVVVAIIFFVVLNLNSPNKKEKGEEICSQCKYNMTSTLWECNQVGLIQIVGDGNTTNMQGCWSQDNSGVIKISVDSPTYMLIFGGEE